MRRALANAVVTAALLGSLNLYAQPRGAAPHASFAHFAGYSGYYRSYGAAPRTPVMARQVRPAVPIAAFRRLAVPPGTGTSLINFGRSSCLLNPSYAGSPYCRQFYSGRPSLGIEPVYPYWFPSMGNETEQPAPPAPVVEPDPLAAQVGNLAAEVEMMREEQALRDSRGVYPAPPAAAEEKPPTTLLVYRDGHQVEVQNYAIQGKTLWVFTDQRTRQVSLADLDLAATERANSDRGVEFVAPNPQ
jgi:hypothetical protein